MSPTSLRHCLLNWSILLCGATSWVGTPSLANAQTPIPTQLTSVLTESVIKTALKTNEIIISACILTGLALIHEKNTPEELAALELNPAKLKAAAEAAANLVVENTDAWVALLTEESVDGLARWPLRSLVHVLEDAGLRPLLVKLLSAGISYTVSEFGWEFGTELWRTAGEMLGNPREVERARHLLKMSWNAFFGRQSPDSSGTTPLSEEDRKILRKIVGNLFQILVKDDRLRSDLFYNMWRLEFATGDTVFHLLGELFAHETLALLSIDPAHGLPSIAVFSIGILTTSLWVPEEYKEEVTEALKNWRMENREEQMRSDLEALLGLLNHVGFRYLSPKQHRIAFQTILAQRARNHTLRMNVYFEKYYELTAKFDELKGEKDLARLADSEMKKLNITHHRKLDLEHKGLFSLHEKLSILEKEAQEALASEQQVLEQLVSHPRLNEQPTLRTLLVPYLEFNRYHLHQLEKMMNSLSASRASVLTLNPGRIRPSLRQELLAKRELRHLYLHGYETP